MDHFVIIVNGFQLLTISTKRSILDVAAALDPPLEIHILLCMLQHVFGLFCLLLRQSVLVIKISQFYVIY